jgi:hypothetical protein
MRHHGATAKPWFVHLSPAVARHFGTKILQRGSGEEGWRTGCGAVTYQVTRSSSEKFFRLSRRC